MAAKVPKIPRNYEIAPGLQRFSKGRLYHKRGLNEKLKKPFQKKKGNSGAAPAVVKKPIGGDKNGKERLVQVRKAPQYIPAVLEKAIHRRKSKVQRLRETITPGTILIVLVGRHRGKRVVFLKQLPKSGLLLVTGPLKVNNTPLRRVAQAFVIATKTKVDVSKVQVPEHINDDYFRRKTDKSDKSKNGIFATGVKSEYTVSQQRKDDQKQVDAGIVSAIRSHPEKKFLFGYLGSRFSIKKGEIPHKMVF